MLDPKSIMPSMKMSILNTIAKQIYSSLYVKIREAVSNSYDNNATDFIYFYDKDNRKLSLFDNGTGITQNRIKEILEGIGYGDGRNDRSKNSYFGLGLFSVLEIGGHVDIYTKTPCGEYNHFIFFSKDIFNEANAQKPITTLNDCFQIKEVTSTRAKSIISDDMIVKCLGQTQNQFTEIAISDIPEKYMKELSSDNFRRNLEKILPLKYNKKNPFFDKIEDLEQKQKIYEILDDTNYCKKISFYSGSYDSPLYSHERYFPQLKNGLTFSSANIQVGKHPSGDFAYFFVYNYEDIESNNANMNQIEDDGISGNINSETGFWVRNKNFLVKPADYFQKPGTRKKILDIPLSTWLYGEILHKDMTDFLVVTRDEYVWSSDKFNTFYSNVKTLVLGLNEKLRNAWRFSNDVNKDFFDPFVNIGSPKSPFKRIESKYIDDGDESISSILKKFQPHENEAAKPSLIKLIQKHNNIFTIVDEENMLIHIDPTVESCDDVIKKWDDKTQRLVIVYPGGVFSDRQETLFGKRYDVSFVFGKKEDDVIQIDSINNRIFLNPFNKFAMDYSLSKLDIILAIEFAYASSKSINEMKEHLYLLLGDKKPISKTSIQGLFKVFSTQMGR